MPNAPVHPYNEAGRKLKAALISYIAGRAGVDSTLKQIPAVVDESWAILAQELAGALMNGLDSQAPKIKLITEKLQ